jgi:hypothetical protein
MRQDSFLDLDGHLGAARALGRPHRARPGDRERVPDRALSDIGRVLITQPLPDPLRGMTLLARRVPIPSSQESIGPRYGPNFGAGRPTGFALDRRGNGAANALVEMCLLIPVSPDLLERLHS